MNRDLVYAQLVSIEALIASIRGEIFSTPAAAEGPAPLRCPECGNENGERFEDTTEMGGKPRVTCLACGKSFHAEVAIA